MLTYSMLRFAVQGAVLLGGGLLALLVLGRSAAATRRLVLALALAGSLTVPFTSAAAPVAWHLSAPAVLPPLPSKLVSEPVVESHAATFAPHAVVAAAPATPSGPEPARIITAIWALGAFLVVARLVAGSWRSSGIARRAMPAVGWERASARAEQALGVRAQVRETSELEGPAVTGLARAVVLVPTAARGWSEERRHAVLLHELAHVRQRDTLANAVAQLALALHWFDPLAWLCVRQLRIERELAADDAVITAGARASSYAEDLLAVAGAVREVPQGALGIGAASRLGLRVAAVLSTSRRRAPLGRASTSLVVAGSAAAVLAVGCVTQGESGPVARASASSSSPPPTGGEGAITAGSTLDPVLQAIAEQELERAMADATAAAGVVVVLDPASGAVVANAGRAHGVAANVGELTAYVTGSTLKIVTLGAALDDGIVTPGDTIDCGQGRWSYQGQTITDHDGHGVLPLPQVLAVSSNIGFGKLYDRLGGRRVEAGLRAFHFDAAPGWMPEHVDEHAVTGVHVAIGQAVRATPVRLAAAYGAVANGGVYVEPTTTATATAARQTVMKPGTARAVLAMLEEAVNGEHGTGTLARVDGVRVAGKTGTASWDLPGGGEGTYASFAGIVPANAPRYVIVVGLEQPRGEGYGGKVAAPVFSRVAARVLGAR